MKIIKLLVAVILIGAVDSATASGLDSILISIPSENVVKIWDKAEHSAFTDLIRFNDAFYCTFREGSDHAGGKDGKVRIIKSTDGKVWNNVALLEKGGLDLRDPKLSITPQGKLMVIMGGSVYENREMLERIPQVSFSNQDGNKFSVPENIYIDTEVKNSWDWAWRVTWHKGVGYVIDWKYEHNGGKPTGLTYLLRTEDGKNYDKVAYIDVSGYPNESTIRFDEKDAMYILIRRDGKDKMGILAKGVPPYNDFQFQELGIRLGGPNFLIEDNKLIIGSRYHV